MGFPPRSRVFVDESKSRGYYVAAAAVARKDAAGIEQRLRRLRTAGRSSIHFNAEGNRRDLLLREFCAMEVSVRVYVMRGARDTVARPMLLRALVDDLVESAAVDVVLERDASVERTDRRIIYERLDQRGARGVLTYEHRDRRDQPLLWIADAAAWCHQAGGAWPSKIARIIDDVVVIEAP